MSGRRISCAYAELITAGLLLACATMALAQAPVPEPDLKRFIPEKTVPEGTLPLQANPPVDLPGDNARRPTETLSDRLNRTDGVIKPPAGTDDAIHVPAPVPNPRTTPVIPSPGSPGGDQSIRPQ